MGNLQERLRVLKGKLNQENLQRLQRKASERALEEEKKRKEQEHQRQGELLRLEELAKKKGELRRELDKFKPEKLLADVKEQVWKVGVIKSGGSDHHTNAEYKFVYTSLMYEYNDLVTHTYTTGPSRDGSYGQGAWRAVEKHGTVLAIGVIDFGDKREVFLKNSLDSFREKGRLASVSDPEALMKLQNAIVKDCESRLKSKSLPLDLAKQGRERIRRSPYIPWHKKIFI